MYPSWGDRHWLLRQQSVQMIAGVPGTYKTMVLLNGLVNMRVPTLAFSNDSDDSTIASRLLGIATGVPCEQTEDWLRTDPQRCFELLKQYDFLQWQFMPSPSLDDIWLETYAYGERYGAWPQLIVVDILGDVEHQGNDEWSALREVMRQSKVLARETKASVLLIHHCSDGTKGDPCPSRQSVMGKIGASHAHADAGQGCGRALARGVREGTPRSQRRQRQEGCADDGDAGERPRP